MSVRRLAAEQPEAFAFTPENLDWAKDHNKRLKPALSALSSVVGLISMIPLPEMGVV